MSMKNEEKLLCMIIGIILGVLVFSLVVCFPLLLVSHSNKDLLVLELTEDGTVITQSDNKMINESEGSIEEYTTNINSSADITENSDESEDVQPCTISIVGNKDSILNTGELVVNKNTNEGYVGLINTNKLTEFVRLYKGTDDRKELIYQTIIKSGDTLDIIKLDKMLEANQKGILSISLITDNNIGFELTFGEQSMVINMRVSD